MKTYWKCTLLIALLMPALVACSSAPEEMIIVDTTCNGLEELCAKRVDEVVFLRAHNSHAAWDQDFNKAAANHKYGTLQQLKDGVRSINMDIYEDEDSGETVLCHGFCSLGQISAVEAFAEVAGFMKQNPREVILIDLQIETDTTAVTRAFEDSGLLDFAYRQPWPATWPTLGAMVEQDKRVLIFGGTLGGMDSWYHDENTYIVSTGWEFLEAEDLGCELDHPIVDNQLIEVTHILTNPISKLEFGEEVNPNPFFRQHFDDCEEAFGRPPNMMSVDYYSVGDVIGTIEQINREIVGLKPE